MPFLLRTESGRVCRRTHCGPCRTLELPNYGITLLPLHVPCLSGVCSGDLLPADCSGGGERPFSVSALLLLPLSFSVLGGTIALCRPTFPRCVPRLRQPTIKLPCPLACASTPSLTERWPQFSLTVLGDCASWLSVCSHGIRMPCMLLFQG